MAVFITHLVLPMAASITVKVSKRRDRVGLPLSSPASALTTVGSALALVTGSLPSLYTQGPLLGSPRLTSQG